MKINNIHDNDGQLDNLFQSARNEAPKYAFTEASSVFSSAFAIGVATAAHAKAFTSSIFKSKIFIMSISTITAITSAALIYSSVNSTEPTKFVAKEEGQPAKSTQILEKPQEVSALSDDTLKVRNITKDSIKHIKIDIQDDLILAKVTMKDASVKVLEMNIQEFDLKNLDVDGLTADLDFQLEEIEGLQIEMENLQEIALLADIDVINEMDNLLEKSMNFNFSDDDYNTKLVTHFVTNHTTVEELDEIKKAATAAGIKFTYSAKIKKNAIKKLNLNMTLVDKDGRTKRECMNMTVSGGEVFSHTLQWREDKNGKAVSFGNTTCSSRTSTTASSTTSKRVYRVNPPNPENPPAPKNPPNPENPSNPSNPSNPEND